MDIVNSKIHQIIEQVNKVFMVKVLEKKAINKKQSNIVWLLTSETKKFIGRERLNVNNVLSNLFYKTAFINEIAVYEGLINGNWNFFNYPSLLYTDFNNYMILECIDHDIEKSNIACVDQDKLVKALVEFQTTQLFSKNLGAARYFWVKIRMNVTNQTFRWIVTRARRKYGIKMAVTSLRVLLIGALKERGVHSLNLHNDLFIDKDSRLNNVLIDRNDKIYFIDFESTIEEKKWILLDVTDMCWSVRSLKPNVDLLLKYFNELRKHFDYKKLNLKIQFRMALMRTALKITLSPTIQPEDKIKWEIFLLKTILDDVKYAKWYRENISVYMKKEEN